VVIRQGGIVKAQADNLEMLQVGIVLARTEKASLTASEAGVVLSNGNVTMEQAGAHMLLTRGDVTMDQSGAVAMWARNVTLDQSGAVAMWARNVKTENSGTVFLFASQVEGTVNAAFGPRESVIFGAVAGAVAGLVLLLARLARRR
jgi:hypothetical protein